MKPISELQKEMYQWKCENFGSKIKHGHQNLLGVIEEMGELAHSILKKEQGIRLEDSTDEKIKDAIGDIFIFLMNYTSEQGVQVNEFKYFVDNKAFSKNMLNMLLFDLFTSISELTKIQATLEQFNSDSKVSYKVVNSSKIIIIRLIEISSYFGWDFYEIVDNTWKNVRKRNWKKYKNNGIDK